MKSYMITGLGRRSRPASKVLTSAAELDRIVRELPPHLSVTSKNPFRMTGANVNSGNLNTGEVLMTAGGAQAMSFWSGNAILSGALTGAFAPVGAATGSGYDAVLVNGPGRIKDVLVHQQMLSGVAVTFYDAGTGVTSGGPFTASGHKIVAIVPAGTPSIYGGNGSGILFGQPGSAIFKFDMPFQSGLAVSLRSGQPGFTVSFVPETNQTFN